MTGQGEYGMTFFWVTIFTGTSGCFVVVWMGMWYDWGVVDWMIVRRRVWIREGVGTYE